MRAAATETDRSFVMEARGRAFRALDTALVRMAAEEFGGGFEEGTLRFFDAVLPGCDRMVDCGAYFGFTSLYAASQVAAVHAFEPSPTNFAVLQANVGLNAPLSGHIEVANCALGERDGQAPLFGKAVGDSGSSLFRDVERGTVLRGAVEAQVAVRDAAAALEAVGIDQRTLVKIDIEGAEYQVVPRLAPLLERGKPFLHVSFHPFNLVVGADEYRNAVVRLRAALALAEVLAHYRFMYLYTGTGWHRVDAAERLHFLRHYLLEPKDVTRIATPQYGFTDAVAFSDVSVAALEC